MLKIWLIANRTVIIAKIKPFIANFLRLIAKNQSNNSQFHCRPLSTTPEIPLYFKYRIRAINEQFKNNAMLVFARVIFCYTNLD